MEVEYKKICWQNLNESQFFLTYMSNYGYSDIEDMACFELQFHYKLLKKQKKKEEEELQNIKNNKK